MGIAALVLGIIGVLLCWFPGIGILGIILAVVALVLGILAMKKGEKGFGVSGIVLGAVAIVLGLFVQISTFVVAKTLTDGGIEALGETLNDTDMQQQLQQALEQAAQQQQQQQQQQQ